MLKIRAWRRPAASTLAAATILPGIAAAAPPPAGPGPAGVTVTQGEFVLLPGSPPLGVFTVANTSPTTVMMTGWSSPACGSLTFEEAGASGGGIDRLTVPAKERMAFVRGGYHLACRQPTPAVASGQTVQVKVAFRDGQTLTVPFGVRQYVPSPH